MNRKQLAQRVNQEIGGDGTVPTDTTTATGEALRYVNWVDQAWVDIQSSQDYWLWMIGTATTASAITVGVSSITLAGASSDYDNLIPYLSCGQPYILMFETALGSSDSKELWILSDQEFAGYNDNPSMQVQNSRPQYAAIAPDGTLKLWPPANTTYSINYRYKKDYQPLIADATTPLMPDKFHMLIVWLALSYYGGSADSNSRILAMNGTTLQASSASTRIGAMYRMLCNEQIGPVNGIL